MRVPYRSFLLAAALLFPGASSLLLAENVSRSDPQTAGEKRLLDWDLSKTYDLSRGRAATKGQAPTRAFSTPSFQPKGFQTKAFSAESFASPEFLIPESKTKAKTFAQQQPFSLPSPTSGKSFLPANSTSAPPKVVPTAQTSFPNASKTFSESTRPFQGPEAARKEQKYTPGNGPTGGVIEGRRLSIDEVREILNKSK